MNFEDYIQIQALEEITNLEKAKSLLNYWLTQNNYIVTKKGSDRIVDIENQISILNKKLFDCFFTSYQSQLIAKKNLQEMIEYTQRIDKYKEVISITVGALNIVCSNLELYKEFKGELNDDVVIESYYREQKQAEEIKKIQSDKSKIKTIENHKNTLIVKADGSTGIDTNEGPKMVIGQVVTSYGDIENEKWSSMRK